MTTDEYRAAFGLFRSKALSSVEHSTARGARPAAAERVVAERRELAAGRATRTTAAEQRLSEALRARGYATTGRSLRALYLERPTSLEALAAELGVGRQVLRRALSAHAIPIRSTGLNTAQGRRARIALNIAEAAARVRTPDLFTWLATRRRAGWSLVRIAAALDRSVPWVRNRLADMEPVDDVAASGPRTARA